MTIGSIHFGLPFYKEPEQTDCSRALRILAVVAGIITCCFAGGAVAEIYHLASPGSWILIASGGVAVFMGLCLKCAKQGTSTATAVPDSWQPEFLLSPTFQALFQEYKGDAKRHAILLSMWLYGLSLPEERNFIPEVIREVGPIKHWESWSDNSILEHLNVPYELFIAVTICFMEKVKKVSFDQSEQTAREIAYLAIERMRTVYFHGTHICHMQSIGEHGISVAHSGNDPQINKLHRIGVEVLNTTTLFGYRYLNCETQDNKKRIFVSSSPYGAASYAVRAPEWVDQFMTSDVYKRRDKQAAKAFLEERLKNWQTDTFLQARKLTDSEAQEFRTFFEKTWERYKELKPVVFVVHRPGSFKGSAETLLNAVLSESLSTKNPIKGALNTLLIMHLGNIDNGLEESIPPSQISPLLLPQELWA